MLSRETLDQYRRMTDIEREVLPEVYDTATAMGFTAPEQFVAGWVDTVAGKPLVKFRLFPIDRGIDIDPFSAESEYQQELLRRRRSHDLDGQRVLSVAERWLWLRGLPTGMRRRSVARLRACRGLDSFGNPGRA